MLPRAWATTTLLVATTLTASCTTGSADIYTCLDPQFSKVDEHGYPIPCLDSNSEPPSASACPGECIPLSPQDWSEPGLVWMGPSTEPTPSCPSMAPSVGWQGFADMEAAHTCPACTCAPPTGLCLPPASIYARASICGATGGWVTPFDAPPSWDGACTAANAIPAGEDCGGAACVQSLNIAPLTLVETGCAPVAGPAVPLPAPVWKTQVLSCIGTITDPGATCADSATVCAPSADPPPSFRRCVMKTGEHECPAFSPYQEKFVVYDGKVDDKRGCAACQCGAPDGSMCTGKVTVWTGDATCSGSTSFDVLVASTKSVCTDLAPAGLPLSSKQMTDITYHPGTCQPSGGEPAGEAIPTGPATFCCLPE